MSEFNVPKSKLEAIPVSLPGTFSSHLYDLPELDASHLLKQQFDNIKNSSEKKNIDDARQQLDADLNRGFGLSILQPYDKVLKITSDNRANFEQYGTPLTDIQIKKMGTSQGYLAPAHILFMHHLKVLGAPVVALNMPRQVHFVRTPSGECALHSMQLFYQFYNRDTGAMHYKQKGKFGIQTSKDDNLSKAIKEKIDQPIDSLSQNIVEIEYTDMQGNQQKLELEPLVSVQDVIGFARDDENISWKAQYNMHQRGIKLEDGVFPNPNIFQRFVRAIKDIFSALAHRFNRFFFSAAKVAPVISAEPAVEENKQDVAGVKSEEKIREDVLKEQHKTVISSPSSSKTTGRRPSDSGSTPEAQAKKKETESKDHEVEADLNQHIKNNPKDNPGSS